MRGFDPEWRDVPHFIDGITWEIWEGRKIGSLAHRYAPGLIVRSPACVLRDNSGVIAATQATLAEFSDRQLLTEDVIWCEDASRTDDESEAFLSSHRLYCTATHDGAGVYGAPTGKRLEYRILADCAIRANRVDDEWLVRDQGAIVTQLGFGLRDYAADLIRREGGAERCIRPMTPEMDLPGPYRGAGNDDERGERLGSALERIMDADYSVIAREWDRGCQLEYPSHRTGHGRGAADRWWMALRAAFPSAAFRVEHRIGRVDPGLAARAAVRWSLHGRHDGWGAFGQPTGASVYVMGITHAEFGPLGIRREWTLIDETAVWKQILLATGGWEPPARPRPRGKVKA